MMAELLRSNQFCFIQEVMFLVQVASAIVYAMCTQIVDSLLAFSRAWLLDVPILLISKTQIVNYCTAPLSPSFTEDSNTKSSFIRFQISPRGFWTHYSTLPHILGRVLKYEPFCLLSTQSAAFIYFGIDDLKGHNTRLRRSLDFP